MKESLGTIRYLGEQIAKLNDERENEINLLDRRLSFLSHPAGKARKDGYIPTVAPQTNNVLMFNKKEN